jgi:hypothetical protein
MTLILALQSASSTPDSIVSTVNRFTDFLGTSAPSPLSALSPWR